MRNAFRLLILIAAFGSIVSAQNGPAASAALTDEESPKITTAKVKWFQEVAIRGRMSSIFDSEIGPAPTDSIEAGRRYVPPRKYYVYQAEFHNEGHKKIKGIVWEFVTVNAKTKQEINRRKFTSRKSIGANKRVTLRGISQTPPRMVADVSELEKKANPYDLSIKILCVLLKDDKIWRDRKTHPGSCLGLRPPRKRR
jgi:hypothetical protein